MSKPTISDLRLLTTDVVFPFYQVYRETPLRFGTPRKENDAEHSWSLALFACALAQHVDKRLNVGLVAQYATVHDLVEVHAGDTSNHASAAVKATKDAREAKALHKLESELIAFPWIVQSLTAYEGQTDQEAIFVRSVDKILPLLFDLIDEGKLYKEKKITYKAWQTNLAAHRDKARKHSGVFAYYEQIWDALVADPAFFYQEDTR
ncbi:MAG TPA: HD domain-containing protein [Candidatus Saccharimonadia bacterium]|nr:HD domain-containing protein [Candidatus Saccharimonadia bacterium]